MAFSRKSPSNSTPEVCLSCCAIDVICERLVPNLLSWSAEFVDTGTDMQTLRGFFRANCFINSSSRGFLYDKKLYVSIADPKDLLGMNIIHAEERRLAPSQHATDETVGLM